MKRNWFRLLNMGTCFFVGLTVLQYDGWLSSALFFSAVGQIGFLEPYQW